MRFRPKKGKENKIEKKFFYSSLDTKKVVKILFSRSRSRRLNLERLKTNNKNGLEMTFKITKCRNEDAKMTPNVNLSLALEKLKVEKRRRIFA